MGIEVLKGKTIAVIMGLLKGSDEVTFECTDGARYKMYHYQDCCEHVDIDDVVGDVADILDSPILEAEEVMDINNGPISEYDDSYTWTFYKLGTIKGHLTIKWYGSSNGNYSERVDFEEIEKPA